MALQGAAPDPGRSGEPAGDKAPRRGGPASPSEDPGFAPFASASPVRVPRDAPRPPLLVSSGHQDAGNVAGEAIDLFIYQSLIKSFLPPVKRPTISFAGSNRSVLGDGAHRRRRFNYCLPCSFPE